jgi:hypothetical protein
MPNVTPRADAGPSAPNVDAVILVGELEEVAPMSVVGEVRRGSRPVAWSDVLGAGILMVLVIAVGGLGLGLALVHLLELLGLPVDTNTVTILQRALSP